jgi:ABC-2 type transport system permease protein
MGLVTPALLALLLGIAQLLPLPVVVRVALPSYAFVSWRALFTAPAQIGPLVVGVAISLAVAVVAFALAYRLFMRRDFTDAACDGIGTRALAEALLPLAALLAVAVGVIAGATSISRSGIDGAKLDHSVATAFAHLYRMQTGELHRPDIREAQLRTSASCDKGGHLVEDLGPGNDWRCVVSWHLPGTTATGSAIYQIDVNPDGRYVADGDGPPEVNGFFQVHTSTGDAPNPLWQFDGSVTLLTPTSPG